MKLSQVLFNGNKFDPKTSRGADNVRSFYKADQGYELEYDGATVRVSCNGRHNLVPLAQVVEMRELDGPSSVSALAAPKTEAVKLAEGQYAIRPKPVEPDAPAAVAPKKRGPGRPPKLQLDQ